MNDRELLELAAKAVGARFHGAISEHIRGAIWDLDGDNFPVEWNPLTDDGDALRLASALDISLRLDGDDLTGIGHWRRKGKTFRVVGNYVTGNASDARRLIVRAAAEIGRSIS